MNVKDLKSFEEVYKEHSINRAAQKLFITPQGLSRNIRMLETELDTVLFERTTKGVRPTKSAQFLMEHADTLIQKFEEIKNGIHQLENEKILLRIGCACGVFNVLPFQLIRKFVEEHPNIQVEWCEYSNEEVKKKLQESLIEYGFIVGEWTAGQIASRQLAQCDVVLLVYEGHPLYEAEHVSLEEIRDENLILMNEYFRMHHDLIRACQIRGFQPKVIAKTADANFQYLLCRQKAGLAVVPSFVLDNFKLDGVRAVPFAEQMKWKVYGVCCRSSEQYAVVKQMELFLEDWLGESML